jgi:hypothetical protein
METAGAVLVTLGFAAMVILAKPFSAWTIRMQNQTWGFKFGQDTERRTVPLVRTIGSLGVALGILYLVTSRS